MSVYESNQQEGGERGANHKAPASQAGEAMDEETQGDSSEQPALPGEVCTTRQRGTAHQERTVLLGPGPGLLSARDQQLQMFSMHM